MTPPRWARWLLTFWRASLGRQLVIGIVLTHTLLMTVMVSDVLRRQENFLEESAITRVSRLAEMLAANASTWMLANDVVGLGEIMQAETSYPYLRYAMAITLDGRIQAHSEPSRVGLYLTDEVSRRLLTAPARTQVLHAEAGLVDAAAPIFAAGRQIGWARVGVGQEWIHHNLNELRYQGLGYIFSAILIGSVLAVLIASALSRRLKLLAGIANRVRHGERTVRTGMQADSEIGMVGAAFDETLDHLLSEEQHSRLLLESTAEGIFGVDRQGRFTFCNAAALRLLGYSRDDELLGQIVHDLTHHSHADGSPYPAEECGSFQALLQGKEAHAAEDVFWCKDGSPLPVEVWTHPVLSGGEAIGAVVTFIDISERKKARQQIEALAYYDALTGLPNRSLLQDRVEQTLAAASRDQRSVALMFLDLDHFKTVNDTLGHQAGDCLLQTTAQRLRETVREADTVARIGGDEFVILLPDTSASGASAVAQKMLSEVAQVTRIEGFELNITPSIGISLYPADAGDFDTLLKNADTAMYKAKEGGRNAFAFFQQEMNAAAFERLVIENSLHQALERCEFSLHYQPQVDLGRGRLTGLEALIRWQHPSLGQVLPGRFIPVAEECGLIQPIGLWVLEEVCRQARQWSQDGLLDVPVSINVSAGQCSQPGFAEQVAEILQRHGVKAEQLEMEFTERTVMQDSPQVQDSLRQLSRMGILLAVDDFGAGYSSLSYLRRLPIRQLKIDQSFIHNLEHSPDDRVITRTIIGLGHSLRLRVLAEGVETPGQFDILRAMLCDQMQGYLLTPAVTAAELPDTLARLPEQCATLLARPNVSLAKQ